MSTPARYFFVGSALSLGAALAGQANYAKRVLNPDFFCEGATFADLDRDGHTDAIAPPFWYAGPDFQQRHELYAPPAPFDPLKYSQTFIVFAHDFDADGWTDVLVIGFPNQQATWYQNPGDKPGPWQRHLALEPTANESPVFGDLLATGRPVLLCLHRGRVGYAAPDATAPTKPWTFHPITPPAQWQRFGHGIGFGDINGDGRNDILGRDGWWEQPASLAGDPVWQHHPAEFAGPSGGAQMYVYDVNGDGPADVISSHNAHGYGLAWFEQLRGVNGVISFRPHRILSSAPEEKINAVQFSQLHAVMLADCDGDGLLDIVTGKRWWAHGQKGDPDPNGTPVLYAFLLRRHADGTASYTPELIDEASGIGTQVFAADINADGRADLLSANKRGIFLFQSQRSTPK